MAHYQRRPALRALESFQWGHSQFSSLRPISVLRHYPSTSSSLVSRSHSLSFFNLLLPFSLFLLFPLASTRTCWLNCLWQAPHPFAILFYNPSNVCIHFIWCDCKVRKKKHGCLILTSKTSVKSSVVVYSKCLLMLQYHKEFYIFCRSLHKAWNSAVGRLKQLKECTLYAIC